MIIRTSAEYAALQAKRSRLREAGRSTKSSQPRPSLADGSKPDHKSRAININDCFKQTVVKPSRTPPIFPKRGVQK